MGDPTKVNLWSGADVFIAEVGTADPSDLVTPWAVDWDPVGILDGEEGFTWEREEDSSEFFGWGGILVKKTRSKHKRTVTFVAMEDNPVVFELVNPGSTQTVAGGITTSKVKVPQTREFAIGFELREGTKVRRRMVKRATAEVTGEVKESETEPTVYTITVTLYPEADATLYTELSGDTAVTP
ncbi:hypothetical protein DER29_0479 [Micromonospora sp. M71_S20]|uniref:phage tail tube protein n=1 Tax=Micromonospora sp. M71_S20 TaxID=592872 RepID=UPI000EB2A2CD|nr:hypothetical protein [Micromonospora sp. M71_S20]RLK22641.1 hypothetical protein DER29_0479 [Micromonospora sp. M71_S20]